MKKGLLALLIIAAVFVLIGGSFVSDYNAMNVMQESVTAKWSQVENVYQRRADLIPNLVETVKGYAAHEKGTLEAVIAARASATQVKVDAEGLKNLEAYSAAQSGLTQALSRLMVVAEKYPDLKANQNFLALQSQLEGTENRITVERQRFNDEVKKFNMLIRVFPRNIVAKMFGFEKMKYFESDKGAEKAPSVKF